MYFQSLFSSARPAHPSRYSFSSGKLQHQFENKQLFDKHALQHDLSEIIIHDSAAITKKNLNNISKQKIIQTKTLKTKALSTAIPICVSLSLLSIFYCISNMQKEPNGLFKEIEETELNRMPGKLLSLQKQQLLNFSINIFYIFFMGALWRKLNNYLIGRSDIKNISDSGIIKVSSDLILDANDQGKYIILENQDLRITLPSPHSLPTGFSFKFFGEFKEYDAKNGPCFISVADKDNDKIELGNNHPDHSIPINSGEYVQLISDKSSNCWHAVNRSAAFGRLPGFEGVAGKIGWQRFPSGTLVQWGEGRTNEAGVLNINFLTPFTAKDSVIILGTYINKRAKDERMFSMGYKYSDVSEIGIELYALDDVDGSLLRDTYIRWEVRGY